LVEGLPKIIAVQSSGCAPLVEAYERDEAEVTKKWEKASTFAAGLRVPMPYASYLILRALKDSKGSAVAVDDDEILSSMKTLLRRGIYACPEAASTLAALRKLEDEGAISSEEQSLLCLTGTALKHFETMKPEKDKIPLLNKDTTALL
jgi:threonine synthase